MNPMLESFVTESRDLLEAAGSCFLELEKTPGDPALLNDLFRSMHTIKGSSGLFDVVPLTKVVHAAEDVLDVVRDGGLQLDPEMVDLFLDAMDQVSAWLEDLESDEVLAAGAEQVSKDFSTRLRELMDDGDVHSDSIEDTTNPMTSSDIGDEIPAWLETVPEELRQQIAEESGTGDNRLIALEYVPDEQCFFNGDDPLYSVQQLPDLLWLQIEAREPWTDLVEFDPYRCVLRFRLLSSAPRAEIEEPLRYVNEQIEVFELQRSQLIASADESDSDFHPAAVDLLQAQLDVLKHKGTSETREGRIASVAGILEHLLPLLEMEDLAAAVQESARESVTSDDAEPLGALIQRTLDLIAKVAISTAQQEPFTKAAQAVLRAQVEVLSQPCKADIWEGRQAAVAEVLKRVMPKFGQADARERIDLAVAESTREHSVKPLQTLVKGFIEQISDTTLVEKTGKKESTPITAARSEPTPAQAGGGGTEKRRNQVLRVDQERIDTLMDLAGELVVAKNALPFLAKRAEEVHRNREMAKEIKAQYAVINRIAEDLQGAVMQVRMVPVSSVFQRFPRLVRDLSRKLDKQIRLVMEGEDTEADKNIVEDLPDPMVHLIRNSIDHGIESPEERQAAGKSPEGEICLRAIQLDDQVIIEISDDGKGIDPAVIKQKAYEKGLLPEEELDTISDDEALQFILEPGFSTAEQVTDLSGRGVGMDVVRTMVKRAGGGITVSSVLGKGSTMRLALPLSMAVTQVMMIETAGESFGVPIEAISETVRIPLNDVKRIKQREMVVLRDRLVPICRLNSALALHHDSQQPIELALLVVKVDGHELGIVVDRFHAGIDIILKPLEGVMAAFRHYSGTALLGDGRVLLVLNLKELVKCL